MAPDVLESATDALVTKIVEDLYSIAKDGLSSLFGVETQVDELSSTFSAIQAVLEDAERHQVTDKRVRDWLLELKEVAYEVEDVLDEWVTDAFISREDKDETRHPKRVRFSFRQYFKRVKLQYDIGQRIRETTKKLNKISIKKEKFNLRELNPREDMLVPNKEERQTSSLVDESEIFGRDDFKNSIIEQLVSETSQEEKSVSVISIVGMGGLGKTTLAQLIYNDDRVKAHFENRIWVCVSDPFEVNKIAIKVIESMGGRRPTSSNPDLDTLQHCLREAIDKKKLLLVLDDVWDENGRLWQKLRVPLLGAASGSKVVVTTRSRPVAAKMEATHIHHVDVLSYSDCWKVFHSRALKGTEEENCRELTKIGEKIVERCKGVPLAVKAVGSLLHDTREQWYWEHILQSEIWNWDIANDDIPKDDGILPALLLSYYNLPPRLQRCFSFCSVFPKDYEIEKDELVKLWMAHGIINSEKAKTDLPEETGEMYFKYLLTSSLFQDAAKDIDGNIVRCKMHDLVHDLATFVSSGDYCSMEAGDSELSSIKCHHLSLLVNEDVSSIPSPLCSAERLRTLLLFGSSTIKEVPDGLFNHLKFLRALNLSGAEGIENLPSSLGNLKHLRYLDLSFLKITELPESVIDLCNLQTLKLNYCTELCILPSDISKMVKLRHLEIQKTLKLLFLPNGLGRLTSFRTLCKFPVGDENGGCRIGELKELNLLRGELSINNLERVTNVNDVREAELHKKTGLHDLSLCCNDKSDEEWRTLGDDEMERMKSVLEGLAPPHSNLKKLEIENYAGSMFPCWLEDSRFSSLVKVVLKNCRKCMLLPGLGKLHSLKYLKIIGADEVKVVDREFYRIVNDARVKETRFPKLEKLHFESMLNWEEWKLTQDYGEVMPSLKTLKIINCKKLKATPNCLPTTLSKVIIENCNEVIWAQDNPLPHLQDLILRNVRGISKALPYVPALKTLVIDGFSCESLLPEGLGQLKALQTLEIQNCKQLSSLPEGLGQLKALQTLEIRNCKQLSSLPEGLGQLKALQTLEIRNCKQLSSLPEGLGQLKALQTLEIWNCEQLSSLPEGLGQLKALQTLGIWYSEQLSSLPEGLGQLKALQTLKIESCERLSSLPEGLGQLKALQTLEIYYCERLSSLPEGLGQLQALQTLDIWNCERLSSLPEGLGQLKALQTLKISGCKGLSSLPKGLGQLKALQTLEIWNCEQLSSLPEGLGQLKDLQTLKISDYEGLLSLPKGLGQLKALQTLQISGCEGLSSLPEGLGQLETLQILEIWNYEQLSSLPEGLGQLKTLQTLGIWYCKQLSSLPEGLGQLKALQTLKITSCERLSFLPEGLGQLKALQTLEISSCEQLSSLSEGLGQLKALQTLEISSCEQLSSLPEGLGQLKALQTLKISDCKGLSSLPKGLGQLKALQTLEIRNCEHLSSLPEGLGQLKALQTLMIWDCEQLSSLPEGLGQLQALQTLEIWNCEQLSSLLEELGQLKALQTLGIWYCKQLSSLPEGLGQLKALQTLKITSCERLSSLPEGLGQLKALQTLEISRCERLSSLPEGLGQLKALQTLEISSCEQLSSLPEGLGQLKALQTLKISDCKGLSSLPKGLGQLKALQTLEIWNYEQLSSLPEGLGQLKALQTLKFSVYKGLSSLPEELGQLKALQTLEICDCKQLSSLPEGLGQLKALQTLEIFYCEQLSSLPEGLGQLKALQTLKISGCKGLSSLPKGLGQLKALQTLKIWSCERLSSLFDGFEQLESLRTLNIRDCPQLRPLPYLQHVTALEELTINNCPLVTERLEKEEGEDWCKISHIPYIEIDFERIQ